MPVILLNSFELFYVSIYATTAIILQIYLVTPWADIYFVNKYQKCKVLFFKKAQKGNMKL